MVTFHKEQMEERSNFQLARVKYNSNFVTGSGEIQQEFCNRNMCCTTKWSTNGIQKYFCYRNKRNARVIL